MIQTLFVGLFITILILFALYKWSFFRDSGISYKALLFAFVVKFIAGCTLVAVYTYIHEDRSTADVYKFMDDAKVLQEVRKSNPAIFVQLITGLYQDEHKFDEYLYKTGNWFTQDSNWLSFAKINAYNPFNANRFITKINAVLWIFTGGNIILHVLVFSFFGFIGLIAYFRLFKNYLSENSQKLLFVLLFFFPGILLWCSAPLKDTLIITFTGIFFYTLFHNQKSAIHKWIVCGLMFYLTLYCKYYVAAAMIPFALSFLSFHLLPKSFSFTVKSIIAPLMMLTAGYLILLSQGLLPEITSFLAEKRMESLKNAAFADAKTYIFQLPADNTFSFFISIFTAPINSLFRPLFVEKGMGLVMIPGILENILLLFLFIYMIFNFKKHEKTQLLPLLFWYILALMIIIGFTSPLAGNIVRYKTAFLPALIGLIVLLSDESRLFSLVKRRKPYKYLILTK